MDHTSGYTKNRKYSAGVKAWTNHHDVESWLEGLLLEQPFCYAYSMTNNEFIIRPYSQKNMDYAHARAIVIDNDRRAEVVTVTDSGFTITRGMIEDEIREGKKPRQMWGGQSTSIVGLNASSNMFA